MRQAERIEQRVHVFHADAVDDDIGGGVVAHGNHQRGNVANREPCHAGSQRAGDAASANEIRRLQCVEAAKVDLALLRLMIQLREYCDLDGAGRGKHFIGMEKIFLPGCEIKNGDAEDTVKIAVNSADRGFQLLPQDLLFLLRNFFLRSLLRKGWNWGPHHDGQQSETEKSFQHGDLQVSEIIRLNGREQRKSHAHNFQQQQAGWTELQEARCAAGAYLVWNTEFLAIEGGFYKDHNRIRHPPACGRLNRSIRSNWGKKDRAAT